MGGDLVYIDSSTAPSQSLHLWLPGVLQKPTVQAFIILPKSCQYWT